MNVFLKFKKNDLMSLKKQNLLVGPSMVVSFSFFHRQLIYKKRDLCLDIGRL